MRTIELLKNMGIINSGNISQAQSVSAAEEFTDEQRQAIDDFADADGDGADLYKQAEAKRLALIAKLGG